MEERARTVSVGVSLPVDIIDRLDAITGDVPRSVYIRRLIEKDLKLKEKGA
jgi:metal-responsive CopG/Arc/MetJ family transcriptional regulator